MRLGALALLVAAALAAASLSPTSDARADGAIAVGSTGNVVKDGIAFGMVVDKSKEEAETLAVQRCRTFKAPAAANRCKVIATFAGECFAVAYDPKPATPGAGWGIGSTQDDANAKAIAMCEQTAGSARKGYCRVESGGCDTTGRKQSLTPGTQGAADAILDGGPHAKLAVNAQAPQVVPPPAQPIAGGERATPRAGSPLLPLGALAGVALAYGLGQYLRGKIKPGITERQLLTGGGLAVATAIAVKLLDMAGTDLLASIAVAALAALGALLLA
ncbi:MAG TPA: DUF4189 domain-containing protein [Hyphomicrobiaceae bacterium]|nr:DUF4189 domain-containing protein [Hyphomicrobiaceae bacterium]